MIEQRARSKAMVWPIAFAVACFVSPSVAAKADSKDPVAYEDDQNGPPIQGYGDVNPSCRFWTDGCVTCGSITPNNPVCSNIGISCRPKSISCTERFDSPEK